MATTINSGYANSPKLTANIADHADVYGGRALVFDGVTDYLDCGTGLGNQLGNNYTGTLTVSMWIKYDPSVETSGGLFYIGNFNGYGEVNIYAATSNRIIFHINDAFSQRYSFALTDTSTDWKHIAFVIDPNVAGNNKVYLNGVDQELTSGQSPTFPLAFNFTNLKTIIGAFYNSGLTFNGSIADVKVYSSALTEAEITSQYLKPESVPSPSTLVAWYPMIEGNPESPQSIVYDHSEKKLSSEKVGDSSFDDASYWTAYLGTGTLDVNTTNTGKLTAINAQDKRLLKNYILETGKLYKIFITVDSYTNGRISVHFENVRIVPTGAGTYTAYFVALSDNLTLSFTKIGGDSQSGANFTLTDISVKEVQMGNHATTNFFGDMADLINESNDSEIWDATNNRFSFTISGWSGYDDATSLVDDTDWVKTTNIDRAKRKSDADHAFLRKSSGTYEFISHPLTLENGKTYNVSGVYSSSSTSSINVEVGASAPSSNSDYTHWATQSLTSSGGTIDLDFTAQGTTGHLVIELTGGANENAFLEHIAVREVGVSSSGFDTAVNEPVVPQVPLMRYNQKMLFDGVDDKVVLNSTTNISSASGQGSVSAVVNISEINNTYRMIIGGTHPNLFAYFGYYSNKFKWLVDGAWNTSSVDIVVGKTYHIVGTWNNTSVKFYVNGVLDWSITDTVGLADINSIGDSTNYEEIQGIVDEVSVWNAELTLTQVQELFNDGVALDATTHSKKGNLLAYYRNDGVTTWQDRRGWSYLGFDGINDKITTNADSTLADVTYIWWMKASDTGSNAGIFGHGAGTQNDKASFNLNWVSNRSLLYRAGNNWRYWNDTSAQDDGQWHCWAVVNDADDITGCKLYVDGVEISVADTANAESAESYSNGLIIGFSGGTSYGEADIAKFAVYSGLKDQTFIDAEFNKGINSDWSSNSDLLGYWKLDNATTVKDLSGNGNDGTVTGATLNDGNDGDVQGSPDSITIREGLNSNKDGLGFYFKNPDSNVLRLNGRSEYVKTKFMNTSCSVYTISCWIKANSLSNYIRLIQVDNSNERYLGLHGNGKVISSYYSGSWSVLYTTATLSTDRWYYLTLVDDDTQTKIYIDDGSPETLANSIQITNPYLHIGTHEGNGNFFDGIVDEVKFYNRELSATEILKNYKHGKGKHKND